MRCSFCLVVLIITLATTGYSQTPSSRGVLTGVVQDQTGAAIVGAKVELSGAGVSPQSDTTDQSGGFRFTRVLPAKYQLSVSSEGFEPAAVEVTVGAQPVAPLLVSLAVADVHLETTVTDEAAPVGTEAGENKDSVALSGVSLSNLPVFDQDYVGAMSRFLDPGSTGTGGASLVVDGVEVSNLGVSASAIKEIKINQDPYSAEFQRPGRGRIEVTTKPGTPEYHGAFNFIFRDARINARDPFALTRPPEQRRIYEGVLTGPVRHSKKTSFLVSANRSEEDLQAVVFAEGPGGAVRENTPAPVRTLQIAAQISHAVSDKNSFSVRESFLRESTDHQGVGGTTLPEAGVNYRNMEQEVTFGHTLVLSPKLVNNFRILLGAERQSAESVTDAAKVVVLDAPPGPTDLLVVSAFRILGAGGVGVATLGTCPLATDGEDNIRAGDHRLVESALRLTATRFGSFYNFAGVRSFKAKFVPSWWESEYAIASRGLLMPPRVAYAVVRAILPGGVTSLLSHQAMRAGADRIRPRLGRPMNK